MKNLLPALIPFRKGENWGFCNSKKQIIIPVKYDMVGSFIEEIVRIKLNDKWGFIDTSGKEITSIKYDDVEDFHNGFAKVNFGIKKNDDKVIFAGKWGIIDKTGKEIIYLNIDLYNLLSDT